MKLSLFSSLIMLLTLSLPLPAAIASEQRSAISLENSPSLGPENAPVTIVEFIDFQ